MSISSDTFNHRQGIRTRGCKAKLASRLKVEVTGMAFTRLFHPPYNSKPLPINTISLNIKGSIIQSKNSVPISKVLFIKDKEHRRDITDIDLHYGRRINSISYHRVLLCSFFDAVDGHFPRTVNGTKRYSIYVSGKSVRFQWKDFLISPLLVVAQ